MSQIVGMKFYSSAPIFSRFYLLLQEEIARPRQGFVPALYAHVQARNLKSSKEAT